MTQKTTSVDQLYLNAESLASDFSLFPRKEPAAVIDGLLTERQIEIELEQLRNMEVDAYIAATVAPTEESTRPGARQIIQALGLPVFNEISEGPFYAAELEFDFAGKPRRIGFITQDRAQATGVWGPVHHNGAARVASEYAIRSIPIVTFMDTPGADPYEEANANNQAHSISRLIAEMCNVDVPTLGIIIGQGYSGGAIPLAAGNLLLSLRTGVFNTIHPKSLANLVKRYNLSWQECAKFVGVSSYELYRQGNIDGIVDYDPGEAHKIHNLRNVIMSSIDSIEESSRDFVAEHPEVFDHYQRNINRYLNPSESMTAIHASSTLKLRASPTEYPNVFGVGYRHLRYLNLRRRIKTTTTTLYGRLADVETPPGELSQRLRREQRVAFLDWLQDPDKIVYEETLNRAWESYQDKKSALDTERGRLALLLFGEPLSNFEMACQDLCLVTGLHLYNRWKASAADNLAALIQHLEHWETNAFLLNIDDISEVKGLLRALSDADDAFRVDLKQRFSFEGRKLFDHAWIEEKSSAFLGTQLVSELNLILEGAPLYNKQRLKAHELSMSSRDLITDQAESASTSLPLNRKLLEDTLWSFLKRKSDLPPTRDSQDLNILDLLLNPDITEEFTNTCRHLILFNHLYEKMIGDLVSVAKQADENRTLPDTFIAQLLKKSITTVLTLPVFAGRTEAMVMQDFAGWMEALADHDQCASFLKSVEEWIRIVHKDKSDTLFVVVSFFFEKILPQYYAAQRTGKKYEGRIEPVRIGRRKDFWNRLSIAYRDLQFQELLHKENRSGRTTFNTLLARYVDNFEELNGTLMSANPTAFPTFRTSIEAAMNNNIRPYGLITGIGDFQTESDIYRVGLVMSNVAFQAGSIDNSDCARFCHLLVECAVQRLPIICFISSGGMQTKEGAAALFTMAVINDRITRFVRDNDLPIIMFGFGHCTGGAQASFVTHPLVQSYYFAGASMPFAGQAVVERNLPFTCLLSNYLSLTEGAMQGLVKHPFSAHLDADLRKIDAAIPLPTETVEQVVDRVMSGRLIAESPLVDINPPSEEDLIRPIKKTLIHARGCTAIKLVSRAMALGYKVVLIQSDPDMDSVPADLVRNGSGHSLVCIGGNTSDESYLNALSVISIAEAEKVDSLHPGIGFLSEDPNFANLVRRHGINFIGPRVASMETMGNKSNAINTSMAIEVPVVPGSHGIVDTAERAGEIAAQIGYPVLLKAVHGGGGKGIQIVEKPEQLHRLFHQVMTEARNAFGNGDIYIEKFVTNLRHIEAQLLRDTQGNCRVIGIRDCSVQRNNQKLMEESDSSMLPKKWKTAVLDYAGKIADAVDYTGAGTVEFIYDIPSDAIYFMEMNTRLQVEHPVTEVVTGVDIVAKQFQIAAGESIAEMTYQPQGYGLEVRINAEKVVLDTEGKISFIPAPGEISDCHFPEAEHIQLISMAGKGKVISPFYDSLIAQVVCHGKDRKDALSKMAHYLEQTYIHGICTNLTLLKKILKDKVFQKGQYSTAYLPEFLERIDTEALIREIEEASGSEGKGINLAMLKIEGSEELKVLSPSTGVFYRAPSPSEPEYVNVGDVITTEDFLCQLEAMKMFTPVNLNSFSNESGEVYSSAKQYAITRINLSSEQQVNEGDLLFVIKPMPGAPSAE